MCNCTTCTQSSQRGGGGASGGGKRKRKKTAAAAGKKAKTGEGGGRGGGEDSECVKLLKSIDMEIVFEGPDKQARDPIDLRCVSWGVCVSLSLSIKIRSERRKIERHTWRSHVTHMNE